MLIPKGQPAARLPTTEYARTTWPRSLEVRFGAARSRRGGEIRPPARRDPGAGARSDRCCLHGVFNSKCQSSLRQRCRKCRRGGRDPTAVVCTASSTANANRHFANDVAKWRPPASTPHFADSPEVASAGGAAGEIAAGEIRPLLFARRLQQQMPIVTSPTMSRSGVRRRRRHISPIHLT